jgi:two-component system, OmpR family, osmolarity sensor histidine kinase EnvZ
MVPSKRPSLLPRSLFGRAMLILLIPMIVLQLIVGYVFFERHYQRVTEQMTRGVARELAHAVERIETATEIDAALDDLQAIERPLGLTLELVPGAEPVAGTVRDPLDLTGLAVEDTLRNELGASLAIDLRRNDDRVVRVDVPTSAGVLRAEIPRGRLTVSNPHQLLVLMVVAALILATIAVVFLRNQVRPIRRLAEAAEAFGKGRALGFRPAGAEEVRRAGAAFLSMRSRIERQIEQRTLMLSGVSHDLRTPLTRMKLTLALMDEGEDSEQLRGDIDEMERMLGEFLAFARGDTTEDTEATDPVALARSVADAARRDGADIALVTHDEQAAPARVPLRPGAIARALQNLLANAARHGRHLRLTVRLLPKTLDYIVEDDGPGIAPRDRTRALQPFARLDAARNLDRGGNVGLGLTIALDIARSHGGTLELGESLDLGGLRATLRLPR